MGRISWGNLSSLPKRISISSLWRLEEPKLKPLKSSILGLAYAIEISGGLSWGFVSLETVWILSGVSSIRISWEPTVCQVHFYVHFNKQHEKYPARN